MDLRDAFMNEATVTFGSSRSLIGIVTDPPAEVTSHFRHGVVLLNPGLVHRVGPGRIYVKIARALAARGFVVFRFDFSGIGDSSVRRDSVPFEKTAIEETRDAIDFLQGTRGIEHVTLLGGCSGAVIALQTAACDALVRQAVLINFPVAEGEEKDASVERLNRAKAHYYLSFALFRPTSWRKLLTGKADYRRIMHVLEAQVRRRLTRTGKPQANKSQFATELSSLAARGVSLVFVCSGGDPVVDDLQEAGGDQLRQLRAQGAAFLDIIPRSDHTFSAHADQERLLKTVVARIEAIPSEKTRPAGTRAGSHRQDGVLPAMHTH
jgi:pimeloyl-ACP methyl ester carboxylesterase